MAYRLLNVVFPLISAGYVARILSADGMGKVAYAQNIVSYFLMFAAMAIPSYGTREIARLRGDSDGTNKLFSELVVLNGLATGTCLLAYYGLVRIWFSVDQVLYLIAGLELAFQFLNMDWLYQGKEAYGYITLRSVFVKIISLLALFLLVKEKQDYPIYALIHCCAIGCNYGFNVYHSRKIVKFTFRDIHLKRHIMPILWLMVSSVATSLYSKVDITMLGAMTTSESVAYYTNAHKIISIVLALVTAISGVFLPRLSYVYETDRKRFSDYLNLGLKAVLWLALPACVGIILVAEDLMKVIFGGDFAPGAGVLRVLAAFTIIKSAGDLLCYQAIISSGKERVLIYSRLAGGAANIVLNAILIPRYGHQGAAIASVISEIVVNGVLLPYGLSVARVRIPGTFLWSVALSTVAMGIAVKMVQQLLAPGVLGLCAAVAAGMAVYGVLTVLTKNELMIRLRKMVK